MAKRPGYCIRDGKVVVENGEFQWVGGFALSQKRKNIESLHRALGGKCLEVSTKSNEVLGVRLSAFNLKLNGYYLENIFQSSKIFENGSQFLDLLNVSPKEAKKDERIRSSGNLKGFFYDGILWPLEPKTAFYDYVYCKAVKESIPLEEVKEILEYQYFTDIEFNPSRSINTQAKSIAIVKLMLQLYGEIPCMMSPKDFSTFHKLMVRA